MLNICTFARLHKIKLIHKNVVVLQIQMCQIQFSAGFSECDHHGVGGGDPSCPIH